MNWLYEAFLWAGLITGAIVSWSMFSAGYHLKERDFLKPVVMGVSLFTGSFCVIYFVFRFFHALYAITPAT